MPYAALFVSDFSVQALVRVEPALAGKPVAVLAGEAPQCRVLALNDAARATGVLAGMTQTQAEHADGIVLRRRSLTAEESAHQALLDCARIFSPRVEDTNFHTVSHIEPWMEGQSFVHKKRPRHVVANVIDETTSRHMRTQPKAAARESVAKAKQRDAAKQICGDLVVLDVAGLSKLFGEPQAIAESIAWRAREFGLEVQIGVGANPEAATLAAKGFQGITIIAEGKQGEVLGKLPVEALELRQEVLETLDRWGVRTCRALASLPEVSVIERLGQEGKRLQLLARGASERLLVPCEPSTRFVESMELEDPLDNLESLAFLLASVTDRLCARLNARALSATSLALQLELVEADVMAVDPEINVLPEMERNRKKRSHTRRRENGVLEYVRVLSLPVPMHDAKLLVRLLQLELQMAPPQSAVRKLTLAVTPSVPRYGQANLFAASAPEPGKVELMLAKIRKVVEGRSREPRVGCAELQDTHRPQAFRINPFRVDAAMQKVQQESESTSCLRMLRPAVDAKVEMRMGAPWRLSSKLISGEVVASAGPWRAAGGWWRMDQGGEWSREEWDLAVRRRQRKQGEEDMQEVCLVRLVVANEQKCEIEALME
jgi:protein ImuB